MWGGRGLPSEVSDRLQVTVGLGKSVLTGTRGPVRCVLLWPWASRATRLTQLLSESEPHLRNTIYCLRPLGPGEFEGHDLVRGIALGELWQTWKGGDVG